MFVWCVCVLWKSLLYLVILSTFIKHSHQCHLTILALQLRYHYLVTYLIKFIFVMKKITKPFYFIFFFLLWWSKSLLVFIYLIFNDFIWITNNLIFERKNFNFLTCFFFFLYVVLMSWESCTTVDFCDCVFIHIYIYIASKFFCSNHKWLVLLNYFRTDYGPPKADIPTDLPTTSWVYKHLPPKNSENGQPFFVASVNLHLCL